MMAALEKEVMSTSEAKQNPENGEVLPHIDKVAERSYGEPIS